MRYSTRLVLLATLLFSTASCTETVVTVAHPSPSTPKEVIAQQLELLKAGKLDALKAGFTERLRGKLTQEVIDKGKASAGDYTLDDLVASVEDGMDGAHKTAKIKMKNGRTLTTLVETDGVWLADTIWFK